MCARSFKFRDIRFYGSLHFSERVGMQFFMQHQATRCRSFPWKRRVIFLHCVRLVCRSRTRWFRGATPRASRAAQERTHLAYERITMCKSITTMIIGIQVNDDINCNFTTLASIKKHAKHTPPRLNAWAVPALPSTR